MIKFKSISLVVGALCVVSTLQALDFKDSFMPETKIAGVYIVTSSETESADIPALWDTFKRDMDGPAEVKSGPVYVIYTDYTGDCRKNNPYTVVIGYEEQRTHMGACNMKTVTIPAASYKRVEKRGSFPENVIALWDEVFNSGFQQKHTMNFERFTGDLDGESRVEIFLAQ